MSAVLPDAQKFERNVWTEFPNGERHIVSACGMFCDTCPAFLNGVCGGCPRLDEGECVTRDCAHRKGLNSCLECELEQCFHYEAYNERRNMMRRRTKKLVARSKLLNGEVQGGTPFGSGGGCGGGCSTRSGGSGGGCGGCSGCGTKSAGHAASEPAGGCPAVSGMLAALDNIGK
ncbi:MAG TPA: DUF3795 domain-containing protein [Limnochordia bacterium]|nr:DUF3795 domain-containing protein [Limnochordia bacterium]